MILKNILFIILKGWIVRLLNGEYGIEVIVGLTVSGH